MATIKDRAGDVTLSYKWYFSTDKNETYETLSQKTEIASQSTLKSNSKLMIGKDALSSSDIYVYVVCIATASGYQDAYSVYKSTSSISVSSSIWLDSITFENTSPLVGETLSFTFKLQINEEAEKSYIVD